MLAIFIDIFLCTYGFYTMFLEQLLVLAHQWILCIVYPINNLLFENHYFECICSHAVPKEDIHKYISVYSLRTRGEVGGKPVSLFSGGQACLIWCEYISLLTVKHLPSAGI